MFKADAVTLYPLGTRRQASHPADEEYLRVPDLGQVLDKFHRCIYVLDTDLIEAVVSETVDQDRGDPFSRQEVQHGLRVAEGGGNDHPVDAPT